METKMVEARLNAMNIDELVMILNDEIDETLFPVSSIHEIDDEDHWDKLAQRMGGYLFAKIVTEYPLPLKPVSYFLYDEERDVLAYFDTKEDIYDYFGYDALLDVLKNRWYEEI